MSSRYPQSAGCSAGLVQGPVAEGAVDADGGQRRPCPRVCWLEAGRQSRGAGPFLEDLRVLFAEPGRHTLQGVRLGT